MLSFKNNPFSLLFYIFWFLIFMMSETRLKQEQEEQERKNREREEAEEKKINYKAEELKLPYLINTTGMFSNSKYE